MAVDNGSAGDGGSSAGGSGSSGGGLLGVHELAARSIDAGVRVILEGTDNTDEDKEGNDDGDHDDSSKQHSDQTGDGHSSSEDELVADTVKEEGEEEGQDDKASQQSNEDKSLGGLDDVADVSGQVVVGVGGLQVDAADSRLGGLLSREIEVNLVGGLFSSGGSKSNSGSGCKRRGLCEDNNLFRDKRQHSRARKASSCADMLMMSGQKKKIRRMQQLHQNFTDCTQRAFSKPNGASKKEGAGFEIQTATHERATSPDRHNGFAQNLHRKMFAHNKRIANTEDQSRFSSTEGERNPFLKKPLFGNSLVVADPVGILRETDCSSLNQGATEAAIIKATMTIARTTAQQFLWKKKKSVCK